MTVWGIHGGVMGNADGLFLRNNVMGLGWPDAGDLAGLSTREDFKRVIAKVYNWLKPGAIPNNAGQLYRFVHEVQVGDLVVYPSKVDRQIHIGRVEGGYVHNPNLVAEYPNHRSVKWLKSLPRTSFSQGALYEIGSALSFFQVRNYADEFLKVVEQKDIPTLDPELDELSAAAVAEDVAESTHDFVIKRLAKELKGHPLSELVADLLRTMGYRSRISPPGADGGIDIIAHKDELGFEGPIIKVQVKSSQDKVSDATVKSLFGNVDSGEHGLFVSLGYFTTQARSFERSKANLRLIDGAQFVDLMLEHYEELDTKYKGLIPLKRVYVPVISAGEF